VIKIQGTDLMENKNKDYEWILEVHALNFIRIA
jgi:hypothetical protein